MKDYQYYGLFLSTVVKNKLMNTLVSNPSYDTLLNKAERTFIDHCTLMHISQREEQLETILNNSLNETFCIAITGVGISDKAIAFRVKKCGIVALCKNKTPHITIATFNGGKPVDSNKITNWEYIEPIIIDVKLEKR